MAFAFGAWRLSPEAFWRLSPREIAAALGAFARPDALDQDDLAALMRRFPDTIGD